MSYWLLTFS